MDSKTELRIKLAAQREAIVTAALVSTNVQILKMMQDYPTLAPKLLELLNDLRASNTAENHLCQIDKIISSAHGYEERA